MSLPPGCHPALLHHETEPQRPTSANYLAGGSWEIKLSVFLPRAPPWCPPLVRPSAGPTCPFSRVTPRPPIASFVLSHHKKWLPLGTALGLLGNPSSAGPAPCSRAGTGSLKSHHQHGGGGPARVSASPPAWLGCLRLHQVMYGPLALPGSDSRWMGSAKGWAQSQEWEQCGGRRLALEKAIPGTPPSLTTGRTGSARGSCLGHGSHTVALGVGGVGSWGGSWHLSWPQFLHL